MGLKDKDPDKLFPIVAIGASAGGLYSLECFISALPENFTFALVFMQHLSPKHKSLLPGLLRARKPDLEIEEISDGLEILPGKLHLCPPGREVRIRNGIFQVPALSGNNARLPIDFFFDSLSEDAGERAVGVIFSGAGTDGARGILSIRDRGGSVFVQDPETAEFTSMPIAAISTGKADAVLPPEDIAREILKFNRAVTIPVSAESGIAPEEFDAFYRLVHQKTGYRFNHYKKSVVGRRVRRRMYLRGVSSVRDYLQMIKEKDSEATSLASDLMIGVTSFFRDRLAWKALKISVIRKLAAEDENQPVRVWTPACATGEEAYSIAMMLYNEFELAGKKREILVFATDVNDQALEKAREGKYPGSIAADLPQDFMRKYFTCSEDGISVIIGKEIRECVVFAKQDLLTDPPFSHLDLIICRNLLIYLEPDAQEKCITLFQYGLKPEGYLFLGNAETIGNKKMFFKPVSHKKCRLYQKIGIESPGKTSLAVPYPEERGLRLKASHASAEEEVRSAVEFVQENLLEEFTPASVAIDQNYNILYFNGSTNRYLRQPRGAPTRDLLKLLPESLRNRFRGAFYRASHEGKKSSLRASITGDDKRKRQVTLRVSKLRDNLFLIVFREKSGAAERPETVSADACEMEDTAVRQLESELSATRAELQSNIEQLRSLNEELQSSNEELHAANEELETSREELQSLNEELITVNSQLQAKIEEQEETNNDLNNFLASTNIPTVFLDHQFRVKRFTPAMAKLLKLIPSDIGRPIVDMSQEGLGPDLIPDARSVLEHLAPVTKEIELNGSRYIRTAQPYRTVDNHIEGVIVTYSDITQLKQAEELTRHLASFPQVNPNPVIELDSSGKITFFNPGSQKILEDLGMDKGDVAAFLPEDLQDVLRNWDGKIESTLYREITVMEKVFGATVHLVPQFDTVRIYAHDITERTRAEEKLRASEERVRLKLDSILSPEGDIGTLELADIIDARAVQSLMNDFYNLAHMPMSIIDLEGRMLVGVGWQAICMNFHRVHPETCRNCVESDLQLTEGVTPGEFKLYKCKNNMWDVATPIVVGGKQVGNLFMGQFFFEGEALDYEFFRAQAKEYGFDEKEYIAALEAVPRLSRESLETSMAFFLKLAEFLSKLSYGNIKLARSLAELEALMKSLRESEERLSRAQEIAHLGSWELDLVNNVLTWSDEVYRIFGLLPREFDATYEAFLERVHPEDRAAVDAAYWNSLREGKDSYEIEHRVVQKKTGEIRHIHEKCEHFRDEAGNIIRSVGMVHDITERKHAEDALRLSERRYRSFVEVTSQFGWVTDPAGRVVEDIPSLREFTGQTYEQARGAGWADALHPDDVHRTLRVWKEAVSTRSPYEIEYRMRRHDGEYRLLLARGVPILDSQGNVTEWVGTCIDITKLKEAEEELQRSLNRFELLTVTAGELLQSTEPQKVVESICSKVMEYLDCHAFFNFMVDEDAGKLRLNACAGIPEEEARRIEWLDFGAAICGCVARDSRRIVAEHITATSDEATELVKSYGIKAFCCHPLLGPGGKVIGTLSFGTCSRETFSEEDLSLMKAVADQVAVAMVRMRNELDVLELGREMTNRNAELEMVNRELEAFIYSISHDLRAPLRTMSGFTKILVEDYAKKLDKQGMDYLFRIYRGSEKMTHLIDDLLRLSRISRQEMERTEVDLSLMAASTISDLREANPKRRLTVNIMEDLKAFADRRLIEIVLLNLLENAWKFTSKTENAHVELGAVERDGKTVYYVRDNGAGFDPNYADKLFRPFHRLHSDSEFEGTGVGLTIVDRIIHRHGGRVWAEGETGKGATVYFTLM